MLLLLLALQMSTTNCIPDYTGGMNCTTMTNQPPELAPLPQAPPIPEANRSSGAGWGLIGLIERLNDRALRKKIGKMIAAGDCEGAANLAYVKGWLEVGSEIKRSCTKSEEPKDTEWDFMKGALEQLIADRIARGDCDEALKLARTGSSELRTQTERACQR